MTAAAIDPAQRPTVNQWSDLIGHDQIRDWFAAALAQNRLSGSFLLVGTPGIGKKTTADLLAKTLLCERIDPRQMSPCGQCPSCAQVAAETHPDVVRVRRPEDKSTIPLKLLIGPEENRMQEGFCRDIRIRPIRGRRKVAILEDADFLNEEGANSLLKTLEEPPSGAVVLLIATNEQSQLPTIRSRCRIIRMGPLQRDDAIKLLKQVHQVSANDETIAEAVEMSGGDLHAAAGLLTGETSQFRQALISQLSAAHPDPLAINRIVTDYVEAVGKEAPKRRQAMREVFSIALQHYRSVLRQAAFAQQSDLDTLARLDRSVRALREVDRSANQATLIECYATDIASARTGDRGEIGS